MMKLRLSAAVILAAAVLSAPAANYTVPGSFPTLAAALSSVIPGDTIDVYQYEILNGASVGRNVITFHDVSVIIQNCTFSNGGIRVLATNSVSVTAQVSNNTFRALRQEGVYIRSDGAASCTANIGYNNVNGSVSNNTWPAIYLVARESSTMNLNVRNNTVSNLVDNDAIVVRAIKGGANITGNLIQNTVTGAGTNTYDRGIWVDVVPKPDVQTRGSFTIGGNIVRNTGGSGIKLRVMDDTNRVRWCAVDFAVADNTCANNAIAGNNEAALFAEVGTTPGSRADVWLDIANNTVDAKGYRIVHGDGMNNGRLVVPPWPAFLTSTQAVNAKYHIEQYNTGVATVIGTVLVGGCTFDYPQVLEDTQHVCNVLTNDWDFHGEQSNLRIIQVSQGAFGSVAIGGTGTNVTYTPGTNFFGSDSFDYTVANTAGGNDWTGSATVTMTVLPVNDPPSFTKGADQNVDEDCGLVSVTNWATLISVGPANESTQTLAFATTNTSTNLFLVQPAVSPAGTLTFTPAADLNGTATVRVWCVDSGGTNYGGRNTSTTQSFVIVVDPVNDAPTFAAGLNQTVPEDAGPRSTNWAKAISAGPADEFSQSLNFTVTNDNPSLFVLQPVINPTGTLTYCSATNANGTALVTVRLHDDGGTANGGEDTSAPVNFTLTVTPVNDPPTALMISSNEVAENLATGTVVGAFTTTDIDVGDSFTYSLVAGVGSADNALFKIEANTLKTAAVLDYEAQTSRTVRVRTTDSGSGFFEQAFTIFILDRQDSQTITFPNPGDQFVTNVVHLGATASSGLPVSFNLLSGPAQLNGTNLTFTGQGTVSVVASQTGDASWLAAPDVTNTFSVLKASQATLVFAPASPQTYNTTNTLTATGGSGTGAVSYAVLSGAGQLVGADSLWMLSGTGSVAVVATKAADAIYNEIATTATVVAAKAGQTITFPAIADQLTTDRVGLAATATSGLSVSFSVLGGPAVLSGGTNLTFTTAGSVSVLATQVGDDNWGSAPAMTNTFNVTKTSQASLTFTPASPQTYNTTNTLTTSGGSGTGAVNYAVLSGAGQLVGTDGLKMLAGTGSVVVVATKAADDLYNVISATATVACARANQTITFPQIPGQEVTNRVGLSASALSGLPVDFSVLNGAAQIAGGTNLTFTASGSVSILATQAGDDNWSPAPAVTNTFGVLKSAQSALVFAPASPQTYNTTNALSATGGSGTGAVSYAVQSGPGQLVGANGLKMLSGTGLVVVVATKATDEVYDSIASTATVVAAKATQAITFQQIPDQQTTNRVGLASTASSGLSASFSVFSGPAVLSGGTNLTFTTAGSVSVLATQAGDDNWSAAPAVTNTFNVSRSTQAALAFTPASPQTYNTTNTLTTSGGSGTGAVSFAVLSGSGQIIGANGLKVTSGTGDVVVTATKAADDLYTSSGAIATVLCAKASQAITFPAIPDQWTTNRYQLTDSASSGLSVSFSVFSGPAVLSNGTNLSFTTAGAVSILATQSGSDNWNPAAAVTNSFNVLLTPQGALTFAPTSPQVYNTTNTLSASGGSGTGSVTYAVASGPGVLVGADGLKMLAGTGSVSVVATKAADALYDSVASTASVAAAKAGQTITFPAIADQLTTNNAGLAATASSGLAVSFNVFSGPATLAEGTNLTFTTAGIVAIVASQAGDDNWAVAPEVTNSFNVTKAAATVTLTNLMQVYDGSAKTVLASVFPTGLVVDVTYNGSFSAPVDAGNYAVTGTVSDLIYSGSAAGTLVVTKGGQVIAFPQIQTQHATNRLGLAASASSGLPVSFAVLAGPAVLADGTNVTFTDVGRVSIVASQAGNANWNAAADVTNTFRVRVGVLWTDYNGDQISDMAVYKTTNGNWYIRTVSGDVLCWGTNFGNAQMVPVPGDYDGDGAADLAVYDETRGNWYVRKLSGELLMWKTNWGFAGTVPVPGDYDGDGTTDLAVYDEARGNWYVRTLQGDILVMGTNWGFRGAVAVPGDYNGDGSSDMAVYDQARGNWHVRTIQGEVLTSGTNWGFAGAIPVPGDYDADGTSDQAVYDESRGYWYIRSFNGPILLWGENWGFWGAVPVPGDYDGDGFADMAVYGVDGLAIGSGFIGNWYIRRLNGDVLVLGENWGARGFTPVNGE